jgi:enamine deaminase RidA (YjgF/YER057c/UK114 family)
MSVSVRIKEMELSIPSFTINSSPFRPYVLHNNLLTVSGQLPLKDGRPLYTGRVPEVVSEEQAKESARLCVINILGWVSHATSGNLSYVEQVVRLGGFVATSENYSNAPGIINAASELITDIFCEKGQHARIAIGVASLPFGSPVEIEATFALEKRL